MNRLPPLPRRVLVGGLLLLIFTAGCARKPPEQEEERPAPVQAVAPRELFLEEWTDLLGSTQPLPNHVARVSAAIEGRVVSVLQDAAGRPLVEGQLVHKGDVIVQLDPSVLRATRDKLVAGLAEFKEQKKQAALDGTLADIELKRLEDLARGGPAGSRSLVPQSDLDKARVGVEQAKSRQAGLDRKQESAEKELQATEEQLKLLTLTAPISGRLGRVQVVTGQALAAGSTVAEITDLEGEIDVLCFVPPGVARHLARGQTAKLADDDGPQAADQKSKAPASAQGKVEFISEQADPETGNFAVKVRFPNKAPHLRSNVLVGVRVLTRPGKACLCIPDAALMEDQEPPTVVIAEGLAPKKNDEGKEEQVGKARKVRALLGVRDRHMRQAELLRLVDPEKKTEIPLSEDLMIVVKGANGLETGDQIKLEAEEEDEEK